MRCRVRVGHRLEAAEFPGREGRRLAQPREEESAYESWFVASQFEVDGLHLPTLNNAEQALHSQACAGEVFPNAALTIKFGFGHLSCQCNARYRDGAPASPRDRRAGDSHAEPFQIPFLNGSLDHAA